MNSLGSVVSNSFDYDSVVITTRHFCQDSWLEIHNNTEIMEVGRQHYSRVS